MYGNASVMGAPLNDCEITSFSHQVNGNNAAKTCAVFGIASSGKVKPEKVIPIIEYALPNDNANRKLMVAPMNISPMSW